MNNFVLLGKRVYLEPLVIKATPELLVEHLNQDAISKYMTAVPHPYTPDDGNWFIEYLQSVSEMETAMEMGIYSMQSHDLMGVMSFNHIDRESRNAELGYWIGVEYQGQGYAKEAAKVLINYGFTDMKLERIYAFVQKENSNSFQLLEALGFIREGLLRKAELHRGKFIDRYIYSVLKEEWMIRE